MTTIEDPKYDYIKPQHYSLWKDNTDTVHVIKSSLTQEEYIGYLKGNILKYQLRLGKKPNEPIERDQNKIKEYRQMLESFQKELLELEVAYKS